MNDRRGAGGASGGRTAAEGTPFAVDVSRDRAARATWVVFLAGPVIWVVHFMVVYLAVEAGCTGGGPGLRLFDPPLPDIVTLAATAVAASACVGFGAWAYLRWRRRKGEAQGRSGEGAAELEADDRDGSLAFAGLLLSLLSLIAVLFVGLPALVLPAC